MGGGSMFASSQLWIIAYQAHLLLFVFFVFVSLCSAFYIGRGIPWPSRLPGLRCRRASCESDLNIANGGCWRWEFYCLGLDFRFVLFLFISIMKYCNWNGSVDVAAGNFSCHQTNSAVHPPSARLIGGEMTRVRTFGYWLPAIRVLAASLTWHW